MIRLIELLLWNFINLAVTWRNPEKQNQQQKNKQSEN